MTDDLINIEIRNEIPADAPAIEAVTISAFLNAPHSGHNEQFIVSALREAGQLAVSLVAVAEGKVIGHVAVSPVSLSERHARLVRSWSPIRSARVSTPRRGRAPHA